MNNFSLLEHHIYFLSTHRGKRESLKNIEFIHSDKELCNIAFVLSTEIIDNIAPNYRLYLPTWVSTTALINNRQEIGSTTYMILPDINQTWNFDKKIKIKKVTTLKEMEDFSLVQGKGFCEDEDVFNEWYPWMRKKNNSCFEQSNQHFYIAYDHEQPVGVCLAIENNAIIGIYAVTTLPAYRKKGISTSLMNHVLQEAIRHGIKHITLQVSTKSYAHNFYKKLGFSDAFECRMFKAV